MITPLMISRVYLLIKYLVTMPLAAVCLLYCLSAHQGISDSYSRREGRLGRFDGALDIKMRVIY